MPQPTKEHVDRAAVALAEVRGELQLIEDALRGSVQQICNEISLELGDNHWYRISDESRIKDAFEIARALLEQGRSPDDIYAVNDLVGARATVVLLSDASRLANALRDANPIHIEDTKRNVIHNKETGYRAINVKGWLNDKGRRIGCEIQIRTALQDAFGVFSRSYLYRSENLPNVVRKAAKAHADDLAVIDESFEKIRELVSHDKVVPKAGVVSKTDTSPREVLQ